MHALKSAGFTLMELTMVIVVVAILSMVAFGKFARVESFQAFGFADSAKATVRFAQKVAIAQRRVVVVALNAGAGSLSVCYANAACAAPVIDPTTGQAMVLRAPSGVSIAGPAAISFDGLGRTPAGATFTISGDGTAHAFVVEAETGYVH